LLQDKEVSRNEKEGRKIMDTGYSKWRKLDNAALAFPLVTGKNDTRVFRFYCQLKEEVNGEILQAALDQTMEKYPLFQAVLRKGLFWFYLERRDIPAVVKKEAGAPCSGLYIPDKKTLLFRVSYYKNRINFEVFHALTDGTGAMHFLMELVKKLNVTVISAIHDLNIAAAYCDKIYVLKDGVLEGYGTPEEVLTPELIRRIYKVEAEIVYDSRGKMHILFL